MTRTVRGGRSANASVSLAAGAHRSATLLLASVIVAACAGPATGPTATARTKPATLDDAAVMHLLSRATFGARPGDVARLRTIGATAWLEEQLSPRAAEPIVDSALAPLRTLTMPIPTLLRESPRSDPAMRETVQTGQLSRREVMELYPPDKRPARIVGELATARMMRAVLSERQLEEMMVDFWFNHFNVYALKGEVRWYVTAYERDVIRPHALGRFRDLVRASSQHPAMLYYLDNWLSVRPDFVVRGGENRGRKAGLNENYARELLELHTLGVDGGYTQHDVNEVARAFTGFTIDRPREAGRFVFRAALHDRGEKVVLGHRIPAGGGESDADRVIDIVTGHPSTARFVATKLVRRFVADTPPDTLVDRVAATFRATDGDIRAMLRTIFAAPEFWAGAARRAKIKKPFEFVASAARIVSARVDTAGGLALATAAGEIGEALYQAQPPTGHPDRADAWVSTGALLARMNFALALVQNRYSGVRVDVPAVIAGRTVDDVLAAVLHGEATAETRAVLLKEAKGMDVGRLVALALGAPEFQRR